MVNNNETKNLLKGAFILTIAALLVKILSAVYRVPFQNLVGDVGFYIYQQVYPFYAIAIILCTYGFPVIISKLYRQSLENSDRLNRLMLIKASFFVLSTIGLTLFFMLNLFATPIAVMMKDAQLAPLIKAVSYVFLIFPFIALFRGVYQGTGNMVPTAISQVGEQFVRVGAILITSLLLIRRQNSLYDVGVGAMYSSVAGLILAVIILLAFYYKSNRKFRLNELVLKKTTAEKLLFKGYVKILLIHGTAVCISAMLLVSIQLIDSLNLYALLVANGMEQLDAKTLKGIYDRGQPLIQLGTVVATSFSLAAIPFITSAKVRNDYSQLTDKISLTIRLSTVISIGAAVGLALIIEPTNIMLFKTGDGSSVLALLSLVIIFSSLIMALIAILQGIDIVIFPAIIIIIGAVLKYVLNIILVPSYSIFGSAAATLISLAITMFCLLLKLNKEIKLTILTSKFIKPLLAATLLLIITLKLYVGMTGFIYDIIQSSRLAAAVQVLSAVSIGGILYILLIIKSNIFSAEEIKILPFGNKLLDLLRKK